MSPTQFPPQIPVLGWLDVLRINVIILAMFYVFKETGPVTCGVISGFCINTEIGLIIRRIKFNKEIRMTHGLLEETNQRWRDLLGIRPDLTLVKDDKNAN